MEWSSVAQARPDHCGKPTKLSGIELGTGLAQLVSENKLSEALCGEHFNGDGLDYTL